MIVNYYAIIADLNGDVPYPEPEFVVSYAGEGGIKIIRDEFSVIRFAVTAGEQVTLTINDIPYEWQAPKLDNVTIPLSDFIDLPFLQSQIIQPFQALPRNSVEDPHSVTDATVWFDSHPVQGVDI